MNPILATFFSILGGVAALFSIITFMEDKIYTFLIYLHGKIPKGFLIFVTGTNGVGKTSVSKKLAKTLRLEYINVNYLREALRSEPCHYSDEEYKILKLSTYLLDDSNYSNGNEITDFQRQCEMLSPAIKGNAAYLQKTGASTVFDGINISPKRLLALGMPSQYVLFVNLRVTKNEVLLKRLDKKAKNLVEHRNKYRDNFVKILETGKNIDADFEYSPQMATDKKQIIHKICIDSTDKSIRRVRRLIIKEIRNIQKNPEKSDN